MKKNEIWKMKEMFITVAPWTLSCSVFSSSWNKSLYFWNAFGLLSITTSNFSNSGIITRKNWKKRKRKRKGKRKRPWHDWENVQRLQVTMLEDKGKSSRLPQPGQNSHVDIFFFFHHFFFHHYFFLFFFKHQKKNSPPIYFIIHFFVSTKLFFLQVFLFFFFCGLFDKSTSLEGSQLVS